MSNAETRKITLIISGSIAAYKALNLIRLMRGDHVEFTGILTHGGQQFITPLSVASLSGNPCYTDLFSLKDETEMGHIRLSREADLIAVVPASCDLMAKMANGVCDDLASTVLLATDTPVMIAPGMNHKMWGHPATQRNIQTLINDGIHIMQPDSGDLACGETGTGRMAQPEDIREWILQFFGKKKPLIGKKALVTSGPTYEAIDPVRYIGNRSSGKQGHAVAIELARQGAEVTLVTGPVALPDPGHVKTIHVENTDEMLKACQEAMPCDIAVCAAAVSDWSVSKPHREKLKKTETGGTPELMLIETPDILAWISKEARPRPEIVVGFAAETGNLIDFASQKRERKGCDIVLANDVSREVFGEDSNEVVCISQGKQEQWPHMRKTEVARKLVTHIAETLAKEGQVSDTEDQHSLSLAKS